MTELEKAKRIVDAALAKGWTISVYDGMEWPVKRSVSSEEIMANLQATDVETLRLRYADGVRIGFILLVWGNGAEDLICDHTDTPAMNEFVGSL